MEMRGIYIEQIIYVPVNRYRYSHSTINVQSKVNEATQSEKFDAKVSEYCEKRDAKNLKRTSETHVKRISVRFVSL